MNKLCLTKQKYLYALRVIRNKINSVQYQNYIIQLKLIQNELNDFKKDLVLMK